MTYLKYAEMKDSGVEGIGDIPIHWRYLPLKRIVKSRVTDGPHETPEFLDDGIPFLSAEAVKNNKLNFEKKRGFISPELHRIYSTKCQPIRNDVLLVKSGNTTGAVAIVETNDVFSIWSPLALIRANTLISNAKYVFYCLRSDYFQRDIRLSSSYGTQPNIGMGVIENLLITVPPLLEQSAIANFLDDKTARIDELIGKKERQIELLAEKRQAVISEAVTKGLNRNAPMRDSGIEWLGEVPAHWETSKVKLLSTKIGSGKTPKGGSQVYVDSGVLFIRSQNVYDDGLRLDDVVYIDEDTDIEMQNTRVKPKDVLLNITGASIGRTCIVPDNLPKANVNQHVCIIRLSVRCVPEYISYYFKSNSIKEQTLSLETGSSREGLNFEQVGNLIVAVPSKNHNEQRQIVDHLNIECSKRDEVVNKIQKQITKLREYRQALITAAVTGKIDVRGEAI
jgi:type I restriction enzyme S subunit